MKRIHSAPSLSSHALTRAPMQAHASAHDTALPLLASKHRQTHIHTHHTDTHTHTHTRDAPCLCLFTKHQTTHTTAGLKKRAKKTARQIQYRQCTGKITDTQIHSK
mmetsp:Transcript_21646/g.53031  ORF Transcript_21646/g.53031 Transcript_21646/m.53031 type:complete len:106 (-) Transcript_21646:583-900(-)